MINRFITLLLFFCFSFGVAQAETVTIKPNDITLSANLSLADGKKLEDGVILMTHGTMAHNKHSVIVHFQELLADNGFSSLAINLGLGIDNREGMYDCAAPHKHKHTDAIEEIAAWMAWLKDKGVKHVDLFGHSRGGNQTAWFASENEDDMVKRVVLLAPQTWNEESERKEYEEKNKTELAPLLEKVQALVKDGKGAEMMKDIDFIYCPDATASAAAFASYYTPEPRFDTPSLLAKIKQPTLVIAGSADDAVSDLPDKYEALSDKGNSELAVVDGAGHMFRDLNGEDAVDLIVEFLQK